MSEAEGKKILLIVNPIAGRTHAKSNLIRVLDIFSRNGYQVDLQKTTYKGHAVELVLEYAGENDIVVCCGGDGTLNEVVSGVMQSGLKMPLGYIPAGTTNDFASSLKLSYKLDIAIKAILGGNPRTLDIGMFQNKRYFNYIASFGAFTGSSYSTPQSYKNSIGHLAYVFEGMKDIPNIRPYHVRVEANGVVYEDDYIFGAVSNSISIGGVIKLNSKQVDLNDGLFEIFLVKNPKSPIELSRILFAITKKEYSDKMIEFIKASEVTFHMSQQIPWSLDGEYEAGGKEIYIRNIHNAFKLLV
ncbi:MAG TPA: diacylglycerol kinase family protein [Mobilitalea sp.]|nr:diacylglycerol kinase family protein [Mobilitalea sp.]